MADDVLQQLLAQIGQQYPALAPYAQQWRVQSGVPAHPSYQSETYPPWERDNPNPGTWTTEAYSREFGVPGLTGEMLHALGAVDPRTQSPVDPQWLALKNQLIGQRTPRHEEIDRRAYQAEGDRRGFDDWMQQSRADAYVRGYLTPDAADNWRRGGVYTPPMARTLDQMQQYLQTPAARRPSSPADVLELLKQHLGAL